MEINVTKLVIEFNYHDAYSPLVGNQYELGTNCAEITWKNAKAYAEKHPILKPEELQKAKDYFKSYGAWDEKEIAAWSDLDVQALAVQEVALVLWEHRDSSEEEMLEENGRLFKCTIENSGNFGQYFYYFGN